MTDYDELVKSLRNCSNNRCAPCDCGWFDKYQVDESCKEIIMWKAADAIEALQAQMPKRGEIVRCGECKYHMAETERTNPYCAKYHCMRSDDWFCADGEREVQDADT